MPRAKTKPKRKWGYSGSFRSDLGIIPEDIDETLKIPEQLGIILAEKQQKNYRNIILGFIAEATQYADPPRKMHVIAAVAQIKDTSNEVLSATLNSGHESLGKLVDKFCKATIDADYFTNLEIQRSDHKLGSKTRQALKTYNKSNNIDQAVKIARDYYAACDAVLSKLGKDKGGRPTDRPLRFLIANLIPLYSEATGKVGVSFDQGSEKYTGGLVELIYNILINLRERKSRQQIARYIQNYRDNLKKHAH